jgi:hypothetical protein
MKYLIIFSAVLIAGCEQHPGQSPETFAPEDSTYKLCLIVDMSTSYDHLMAEQGRAREALLTVVDTYFRDRVGGSDKLILAQISAKEPALIWEGTPQDLRDQFDPKQFAAFLHDHSSPDGSPVHLTVAKTLEYVMSDSDVASGKTKPVVIVLSDMLDNFERTPELKSRILRDLKAFGKLDGAFGIYYCDSELVIPWKKALSDAGIKNGHVEGGIVSKIVPPSFD